MKKKFNRFLFFVVFLLMGLFVFTGEDFVNVYAEEPETTDIQNVSSEPVEDTDDGSTADNIDPVEEPAYQTFPRPDSPCVYVCCFTWI